MGPQRVRPPIVQTQIDDPAGRRCNLCHKNKRAVNARTGEVLGRCRRCMNMRARGPWYQGATAWRAWQDEILAARGRKA